MKSIVSATLKSELAVLMDKVGALEAEVIALHEMLAEHEPSASPSTRHPLQPLALDAHGTMRFKGNAIVRHLLDHGGVDLNKLACMDFTQDDREQFAQLIGRSLGGFLELSYVSDATAHRASVAAERVSPGAGGGCRAGHCAIHSGVEREDDEER